jgi:hypothetical protein
LEFGFSSSSGLFSCPGSLADESCSAFRVSALSCALAVSPVRAAVANAAELIPRKLLRDGESIPVLSFVGLLIMLTTLSSVSCPPTSESRQQF